MKHLLAAAAVLLCSSGSTFAVDDALSANNIMPGCRAFNPAGIQPRNYTFMAGVCLGSTVTIIHQLGICNPSGVTDDQVIKVVVAYIDARPARLHENFSDLAREALLAAWPCPASPERSTK